MTDSILDFLRWYGVIGSAIMLGLFFSFSVFMLQSFNKIAPAQAIAAMQSINANIGQPLFGVAFGGTALVAVGLGGWSIAHLDERHAVYALIGCALFLLGTIVVTVGFNIPLNNDLDKLDPNSATAASDWKAFVESWLPWNHLRTLLNLAATVFFILSIREAG
jgi:uncharacterized membrane protein